jgi:hypothetical protein
MSRYFKLRDEHRRRPPLFGRKGIVTTRAVEYAHVVWRKVRPRLSPRVAATLGRIGRKLD